MLAILKVDAGTERRWAAARSETQGVGARGLNDQGGGVGSLPGEGKEFGVKLALPCGGDPGERKEETAR